MSKLTLTDVQSGFVSIDALNANNALIETALENTLSRDGTGPNAMSSDMDMNSYKIINLAAPVSNSDAARLADVQAAIAGLPTASTIPFTPYHNISAVTTQGAIQEEVDDLAASSGSSLIGFIQSGTGAVARTVQDKNRDFVSVKDFGAVGDGVTDDTAAFTLAATINAQIHITQGTYLLNTNPVALIECTWFIHKGVSLIGTGILPGQIKAYNGYKPSWLNTTYSSVYSYLADSSVDITYAKPDAISSFQAVRTSQGTGGPSSANIGQAVFAYNDKTTGTAGAWGLYSTVLRDSTVQGPTHGLEVDVANMGALVPLYPNAVFSSGQTAGIWLCTGGEATNVASVGIASCALAIIRNDSNITPSALFDKGIIFHSKAISGTDGVTGNGIAIAFSSRHQQLWFNNSNQVTGEIVANTLTTTNAIKLDLSDYGFLVQDRTTGGTNFQVQNTPNSVNYLTAVGGVSGNSPSIVANGAGIDLDLVLTPKGTGTLRVSYGSTVATTPTNFVAQRYLAFKDGNNIKWYIPISTTTW